MPKKIIRVRGGFRNVSPPVRTMLTTGIKSFNRFKSTPQGQVMVGYATDKIKRFALNKAAGLMSRTQVTPDGVKSTAPKGTMGRNINTPPIHGAYGSVTRTVYVEGTSVPVPKRYQEQGKNVLVRNATTNLLCTTGAQAVAQLSTLPNLDLWNIVSTYANIYNTSRSQGQMQGKCYIKQAVGEIKITNASNVGVTMDIYEVVPKYNIQGSDTNVEIGTPVSAWERGLQDARPNGITGTTYTTLFTTTYGVTPLDAQNFSQYYSVKKVYTVELPATTTHVHDSVYNIDKVFDAADITLQNSTSMAVKHFTKWTMIVVKGNPVHDVANVNSVTTSQAGLDITFSMRAISYGMPGSTDVSGQVQDFPVLVNVEQFVPGVSQQTIVAE